VGCDENVFCIRTSATGYALIAAVTDNARIPIP